MDREVLKSHFLYETLSGSPGIRAPLHATIPSNKSSQHFRDLLSTQGSNLCIMPLHWQVGSLPLEPPGKFPGGSVVKNLPTMQGPQEMQVRSLGQEHPLEEGMATHSRSLAWRIPWTEEPGEL